MPGLAATGAAMRLRDSSRSTRSSLAVRRECHGLDGSREARSPAGFRLPAVMGDGPRGDWWNSDAWLGASPRAGPPARPFYTWIVRGQDAALKMPSGLTASNESRCRPCESVGLV